jgi:protoporphyrinogen oxidase
MKNIAVIGGGISGLSIAQCLKSKFNVKVYEKESKPGGLIKCEFVGGNLYHPVGGHVFNSKNQEVLNWFWNFFNRDTEFHKITRNAIIAFAEYQLIHYPVENHIYMFDDKEIHNIINELLYIGEREKKGFSNFEEFLQCNFGKTLYQLYFKPYNEKIWQRKLTDVPLSWLEGKLPMPSVKDMIFNNFVRAKETNMVHSSFHYPLNNGSQFIADRLSNNLEVLYNTNIERLCRKNKKWVIDGDLYDKIVFSGNIKELSDIIGSVVNIDNYINDIRNLEYHGTTSVLCEIDKNPYSWIYLPSLDYCSHRIICTGNFSYNNNIDNNKLTATVEFTDYVNKRNILENLKKMPFNPKYMTHIYTKYTYPIQNLSTKKLISQIKCSLEKENFYLLGRFAEWEYYNMDNAIEAALILSEKLEKYEN